MRVTATGNIYEELGVKRVINATGNLTKLGGSMLAPELRAAMEAANESFVEMAELMEKSGQAAAELMGTEAAYITSGCFAALVLSVAGIMTGNDREKIARLPDTADMKNEFLIQKAIPYPYHRCVTVPGGKLIGVGDERGATVEQLEAAVGPRTAGMIYFARAEGAEGTLSIAEVAQVARRRGIPVLVDAAAEVYPLERMIGFHANGADLVCFGAKYFGAPNSSGMVCGRRDLVEAAAKNGFVAYETEHNDALGRGYKLDRQEIVAVVAALRVWMNMNHEERLQNQSERIQVISSALSGVPHINTETLWGPRDAWMRLRITVDEQAFGKTATVIVQELAEGDPSVQVRSEDGGIVVVPHTLREDEVQLLSEKLRGALTHSSRT